MVEAQLAAATDERQPVLDARVLQAFRRVPRHAFVPEDLKAEAYADRPLAIPGGQTISQPYVVAKMTELLDLAPGAKVLEVGTGSGYQSAILAELGCRVVSIERDPQLAEEASSRLAQLGYSQVKVVTGDGYRGLPQEAPFDAIVVTAAVDHVPPFLIEQLADGGRLVLPLGSPGAVQQLRRVVRRGERVLHEMLFDVRFVPLTGECEQPR
jgi:protein-L-isoaspartate(D-aspartate) O-methyltransferase